ncbi:E1A-binding protein p400 isoform X2 [Ambystoma mexicanum]|uniref:E1A-binding protein p400 isoform X2 n=1 Tax=Ambystoma mexicanum TaxID=8296 RepID=UPI0037E9380E
MHHGSGPPNSQLQRSRSFTGTEGDEQLMPTNLPQSPVASFAPSLSPSGQQSPSYQIQQLIMSRNTGAGQNVNITLQNVGQVVSGNQQITLTPLPLPNPASPGFQFNSQQRRFEHGSPSYIQVTSPLPQQVQSQSPTQPGPMPIQTLQNVRTGTPGPGLTMCSQSPTRGFVDGSMLVRQINLSPSNGTHFVFQDASGMTQITQAAQVQLQPGTPTTVRERRLSQPHSQTGGTIHHLGPQSPLTSVASMQPLSSPGLITTNNLPPQISSIIQGQLIQQQQVLHRQQLSRSLGFERTTGAMLAGVGGSPSFGLTSPPTPTSPSRATGPQCLSGLSLVQNVSTAVKRQPKKLEEIPPAKPQDAQMRQKCLEHHHRQMKVMKEALKEYLIELFFLQQLQGNIMDFLTFRRKHCVVLQAYLRQNELELDDEEDEEQSEVINDEQQTHTVSPVAGTANAIEIEAFKRQAAATQADPSKRPRLDVTRHGMVFQHPGVASGVSLQQLMPTAQGGMPPTVQMTGQKPSQQQYDPSKGPPVQNAASLHTPPPQLPARLPPPGIPIPSVTGAMQLAQLQPQQQQLQQTLPQQQPQHPLLQQQTLQQPQQLETPVQPQPPVQVKKEPQAVPITTPIQNQHPASLHQPLQTTSLQTHMQGKAQAQAVPLQTPVQQHQPTAVKTPSETCKPIQRSVPLSLPAATVPPPGMVNVTPPPAHPLPTKRISPATSKSLSPVANRSPGSAGPSSQKSLSPCQSVPTQPQESKMTEQLTLENKVHQRIAELRKEGVWSMKKLPKLQEPPRPKSHWDYVLEEMEWMAADFAQERRWKMAAAKKLVRTAARHCEEKQLMEERAKREEESRLRRIAASAARQIQYFWSNIEQVVEIKLQVELEERRKKVLQLQRVFRKGSEMKNNDAGVKSEPTAVLSSPGRKRKTSLSLTDEEVEDEEETIAEQELKEGNVDHHLELSNLAKEADLPLNDLLKHYEGAYAENFHWPQPKSDSEDEPSEQGPEDPSHAAQKPVVLIDSLLNIEPSRTPEQRSNPGFGGGKKHTRDIAEVAAAAELLLPRGSARITSSTKLGPPSLLHGTLREYQQIGLDWLVKQYRKNLNGILADEAGLGKNVQVIALLAHLACNEGNWGPHLIVVRSCRILKWELEFKRWCPGLKILLYFGRQKELRKKRQEWLEPNSFNVCITSYKQLFKGRQAFMKMRWKYLILDEVQQIKPMTEKHWGALLNLRSQRRLLLRDTPLQNTMMELWTMVHFLIPGISRSYLDFPVKAGSEENQDYGHKVVIRLHRMTQPFILRRSKRDVERQLTKKYEHVLKCRLSNRQKALYEDVILHPETQDAVKGGHFVSVLRVLMELQKICNHPDLVDPRESCSSYVSQALEYCTASLALKAFEDDLWKNVDLSLFNLIGIENEMTRHEAHVLPKQKVSRKLIEEIYNAPDPPPRPAPVKIKPKSLFLPVPYGQKPEGKTVTLPSPPLTRTVTTTTATVTQQTQVRGRPPVATASANPAPANVLPSSQASISAPRFQPAPTVTTAANLATPVKVLGTLGTQPGQTQPQVPPHTVQQSVLPQRLVLTSQAQARLPSGEVVKMAQLASAPGAHGRVAQSETPVTLQFQGNKFTLSQSQLRQLTAGQPLQLQGNVLQIVSAPGQQYLRPPGPVVMQPGPPVAGVQNAVNATTNQHQGAAPTPAVAMQPVLPGRTSVTNAGSVDVGAQAKPVATAGGTAQESMEEKKRLLKERLDRLFFGNERRCGRVPVYGRELLEMCSLPCGRRVPQQCLNDGKHWRWSGFQNCRRSSCLGDGRPNPLQYLVLTPDQQQAALEPLVKRVLCAVPAAIAAPPSLYISNPPASLTHGLRLLKLRLREQTASCLQHLRVMTTPHSVRFPDLRLVQYDSGKFEALAVLLQKLKSEGRRVLIFSQMILMLDILELFLNFHLFTYLRIDENANTQECQDLMKSFNRNRRYFCALLSTHSHTMGTDLVDADTVVFYDNDLNPVMDTKIQEWCDRIGRCKDVHIYRLVSGNSIEEKLLKNGTKDLIREVAAQGNNYSTAFLTQQTIQELFEVYTPPEDSGFRVKAEEFVVLSQEPSPTDTITPKIARPFIEALSSLEEGDDDPGGQREEAEADPTSSPPAPSDVHHSEEPTQAAELADLMDQLTPIERYAMHYLEIFYLASNEEKQRRVQEELKAAKKAWELQHYKELKELRSDMLCEEETEEFFTYTREDAYNMEYVYEDQDGHDEIMPLWTPPTPPQDENDIYIDSVMCLMYDLTPIPESKLPPVYVRKERKRQRMDPTAVGRKKKLRHGETVIPPRSLFDRATPGMLKIRREGKEQKKNILLKQQTQFAKPLPALVKPTAEPGQDNPEWLISEDWALLQAVKQLLELPLNLSIVSPAHTANWDLVSDVVNSCSRIHRSSKQCRSRYENVIIPREEGKIIFEVSPKKKAKNLFKNKNSRPLRTGQIYSQDESATHTQLYTHRFELMKMMAGKRSAPIKPLLGMNPFQKNPKHASVLAESGITYEKPLPPIQVASLRAERIAKEKKVGAPPTSQTPLALVEQARTQQQTCTTPQPQQNGQPQQPQQATVQQAPVQPQPPVQPQVVQQPQTKVANAVTTVASTALLAGAIKPAVTGTSITTATVSGNVIVNTVAGVPSATFQPLNKRLVSPVVSGAVTTSGATVGQVLHAQQRTVASSTLPAEMVTITTNQGVRTVTSAAASVVPTSLTPVQTQTRSLVTQVTPATTVGVQLTGKTITPAQFQLLRQQQAQVQVSQMQAQAQAQSPNQIKAVGKISQEQLLKLQKQKLQLPQQQNVQQGVQVPHTTQVSQQQTQQLTTGTVLTGTTVTNLQVARLLQAQGQIQAQSPQTAQVALTKPPVVSVPATVVSSAGVPTLPVTVAGISVAIGQPHKAAGGQPLHVQPLLKLKQHHAAQQQQQKALQSQGAPGQPTVQQKSYFSLQITAQQAQAQQQKMTYTTQPAIKTQFLTTSMAQAQKQSGAQQVQTQIQVAKLPQVVQQQATVANIQQMVSAPQQVQPQTVTFTQTTTAGQQVQVIPAGSAAAQVVQQKLMQQQVVAAATAASAQIQAPSLQNQAQADAQKLPVRTPTVRLKAPTKPS